MSPGRQLRPSLSLQLAGKVTAEVETAVQCADLEEQHEAMHRAIGVALDLLIELNKLALETRL